MSISISFIVIRIILLLLSSLALNSFKYPASCSHAVSYSSLKSANDLKEKDSAINPSQTSPNSGQVFVCTNKWCREKGSDATMAAFTFLTPEVRLLC
jgi:hypothetical protein